jgi:hypothetical protein
MNWKKRTTNRREDHQILIEGPYGSQIVGEVTISQIYSNEYGVTAKLYSTKYLPNSNTHLLDKVYMSRHIVVAKSQTAQKRAKEFMKIIEDKLK